MLGLSAAASPPPHYHRWNHEQSQNGKAPDPFVWRISIPSPKLPHILLSHIGEEIMGKRVGSRWRVAGLSRLSSVYLFRSSVPIGYPLAADRENTYMGHPTETRASDPLSGKLFGDACHLRDSEWPLLWRQRQQSKGFRLPLTWDQAQRITT